MDIRDWAIRSWHILQEWSFCRMTRKYGRSYYTGLTQFEMEIVIGAVVDALIQELVEGGEVRIAKLGRFQVVERSARQLRSNLDDELYPVQARRVVRFSPSAALTARLNADLHS